MVPEGPLQAQAAAEPSGHPPSEIHLCRRRLLPGRHAPRRPAPLRRALRAPCCSLRRVLRRLCLRRRRHRRTHSHPHRSVHSSGDPPPPARLLAPSSVFAVALPRFTGLGLACSCRGAGTGRPRPSGSRRGSAAASPSGRPRPAWRCAAGHQRRQQQRRQQTRSALKTTTECHAECFSILHVSDR